MSLIRQHLASFRIRRQLWLPLAVAAALRLGLMMAAYLRTGTEIMTQGDTASYLEPGRNLLLHAQFASAGLPEIDRTPGYPIFVMLTGMIFGNILLAAAAQIAVALASLLLVVRIADRTFRDPRAALLAAWLFACEPASIAYSVRLMPETLFVFLMLIVVERLVAFQSDGKLRAIAAAGVALAAATYVRPVSYYLAVPLAVGLLLISPHKLRVRWKAPTLLLAIVLPLIAAWQVRNRVETGYSGFSSIVETNLYFFQSAEVTAEISKTTLGAEQAALGYPDDASYEAAHPEQRNWSRVQRLHFMRTQSVQILAAHPGIYLRSHMRGVAVVAFTPCASEWLQLLGAYPEKTTMPRRILNEGIVASAMRIAHQHPGTAATMAILEVCEIALFALAIAGLVLARAQHAALLTLACVALYFLLIAGGAQAVGRYRLPAIPEICVLAAGGLLALQDRIGQRARQRDHELEAEGRLQEDSPRRSTR